MKKSFVFLTGMLVMACGSSKIDESVTLQSEEAVQFDRSLMEVPKKADDLNGINGAIGASKNQFHFRIWLKKIHTARCDLYTFVSFDPSISPFIQFSVINTENAT